MSNLTPNLPETTTVPRLTIDSRELGIGSFRVALRVTDSAGNVSTNQAVALVRIQRGPGAVAVLRAPPIVLTGVAFPLHGGESYTKGGLPPVVYIWSLTPWPAPGQTETFRTETPSVVIGGPPLSPFDRLPRNLPAGRYRLTLVVVDASGNESAPDVRRLTVVNPGNVGALPIAAGRILTQGLPAEHLIEGRPFQLDATGSQPASTPAGTVLRRYLWTWFPVAAQTPGNLSWEQETSQNPVIQPGWPLRLGFQRFRLVVIDNRRRVSEPTDLVIRVLPP